MKVYNHHNRIRTKIDVEKLSADTHPHIYKKNENFVTKGEIKQKKTKTINLKNGKNTDEYLKLCLYILGKK